MRGVFLGSGGTQSVHLPTVIADQFGCSQNEGRKLIDTGQVKLDGEVTERVSMPLVDLAGHQLTIGSETVEVPHA